jgi:hypothetical protein
MMALALLLSSVAPLPPAIEWAGTRAPVWSDTFGSPNTDWVNGVTELANGEVAAVGFVNRGASPEPPGWDLIARRYVGDGRLLWSRRIGGPGLDAGWAVAETPDGRIAIAGPSAPAAGAEPDAWLLLLSAESETLGEGRYGGAGEDFVTGMDIAPDGGFVLAGWTRSMGAGERDVLLIRTDAEGREIWRRAYGGPGTDRGFYVRATGGGYVVAGVTGAPEAYDFLLMKVDEDGEVLWRRVVGGDGNDATHGLTLLPDGRIRLIGYTRSWGARDYDIAALTLSPGGELLRHALLGAPGDDRAQFSATAADGSTWVTGYTRSFSAGGDWDILVARVRPDGAFEPWLGAIGTAADDNGSAIALAVNGDLLIGGYTAAPGGGEAPPDGFVMRVSPDGIERREDGVVARDLD